jgi:hypothetical protein
VRAPRSSPRFFLFATAVVAALCKACSHDWDGLDPGMSAGAGGANASVSVSSVASSGSVASASAGTGGIAGTGGAGCAVTTYPQAVLALPGLVSYWRLDETSGSVAKDRHGTNNGTYLGATLGQPSLLGGDTDPAIGLDGTSGQVAVADAPSLDLTGSFTLSALIKPSSVIGKHQIVSKTSVYWIQIVDGGLEFAFVDPTMAKHALTLPSGFTAGTLVHVVATYDGQALRVYLNGVLSGSQAVTATVVKLASQLFIGTWDGKSYFFAGEVDEVFVTGAALTAARVSKLYAASVGCGMQ